jgi:hypothetical protein
MNRLHPSCFLTPGIQTSGDVSRRSETSADSGGDDGNDGGAAADGDDVSKDPEKNKKSISDELAEIQSSLAMIGRQNKVAHGILVYLILSTTIPAMTLIRVSLNAVLNPLISLALCILGFEQDPTFDGTCSRRSRMIQTRLPTGF